MIFNCNTLSSELSKGCRDHIASLREMASGSALIQNRQDRQSNIDTCSRITVALEKQKILYYFSVCACVRACTSAGV